MNVTPKVRDIVNRMISNVLAHPKQYDQAVWPTHGGVCQTAYCGAGHLIAAADEVQFHKLMNRGDTNWLVEASHILGVYPDSAVAISLFLNSLSWPYPCNRDYGMARVKNDHAGMANAFAARWRQWLETDGTDGDPGRNSSFIHREEESVVDEETVRELVESV